MRYFLCFFNHCIFCRQTEVELKKKHDQSSNSRKKIVGGHGRWLAWRAKKGSNHLHWNALSNALFSATAAWLKPPLSRTKIIDLIQSKDLFRIHRNFLDFAEFSSRIRPWHWFHTRFISRGMCDKWNVKNLYSALSCTTSSGRISSFLGTTAKVMTSASTEDWRINCTTSSWGKSLTFSPFTATMRSPCLKPAASALEAVFT